MEWLMALVPLALCGAMCVGGAVLTALGISRSRQRAGCHGPTVERKADSAEHEEVDV